MNINEVQPVIRFHSPGFLNPRFADSGKEVGIIMGGRKIKACGFIDLRLCGFIVWTVQDKVHRSAIFDGQPRVP